MVIKDSAAREIARLVGDLRGDNPAREAAIARLGIIGTRAVARLLDFLAVDASTDGRAAALQALEIIGDRRAVPVAEQLLGNPAEAVAVAAASVLHGHLASPDASTAVRSLERLTAASLDKTRPLAVRLVALDGLRSITAPGLDDVLARIADDPEDPLCRHLGEPPGSAEQPAPGTLHAYAAASQLPLRPAALRNALSESWAGTPLSLLHRLVGLTAAREVEETDARRREEWRAVRGDVHLALARRGSRVALYDLRDTVAAAVGPLPDAYVTALSAIGDARSLDAIAVAYARSTSSSQADWRRHLREAFGQIVTRERLTGRHAILKRIRARWPDAAAALLPVTGAAARQ